MRLWWLVVVVTNVELLTTAEDVSYVWCDTIECTLLFLPSSDVEKGAEVNKFVYVPNQELYEEWGDNKTEIFIVEYGNMSSNYMYPGSFASTLFENYTFTYTYIPSLGRFNDIIKPMYPNISSVTAAVEWLMQHRLSTIYSYGKDMKEGRCMDKYGYRANYLPASFTCMSLLNLRSDASLYNKQYYTGPVTWNRIRFDQDDYMLRLMLTNNEMSAILISDDMPLSMADYLTCKHTNLADTDVNACHAVFGLFSYSRICCCYTKYCDNLYPSADKLKEYQVCPYGQLDIDEHSPIVRTYEHDHFGEQSIAKMCYVSYDVTVRNDTNGTVTKMTIRLRGTNDTSESWHEESMGKIQTCRHNITQCPNIEDDGFRTEGMSAQCYCEDPAACFKSMGKTYNILNAFYGATDVKDYTCLRITASADSVIAPDICATYIDTQLKKFVRLVLYNNMVSYDYVGTFKNIHLDKYDERLVGKTVNLYYLIGYVQESVLECEDTVYPRESIQNRELRAWYFFMCNFTKCDQIFEEKGVEILEKEEKYKPHCLEYKDTVYNLTHADLIEDFEAFFSEMKLENNVNTSFCVIRYISPVFQKDAESYSFKTGIVTSEDYKKEIDCPSSNNKSDDICIANKHLLTFCCRPYFSAMYNGDAANYTGMIQKDFQTKMTDFLVPTNATDIESRVADPGSCILDLNGMTTTDVCVEKPGCFSEFLFSTTKNHISTGCIQSAVATTKESKDVYIHYIHAGSICDIKHHYTKFVTIYNGTCAVVNNGMPSLDDVANYWQEDIADSERLRTRKLLCCCREDTKCGNDLVRYLEYYGDFLDENQDEFELDIKKFYNVDDIDDLLEFAPEDDDEEFTYDFDRQE
ncbi:unnamed protein product [Bursaphelenchus okinawaensis]|uniref:Uncharacterized protein n=1 Tax=Bursaphelenchus okinawaensis TaxID=465554 RepID=A0A811JU57_9BILA|nr:unnamed protein product [Bursaphelenchus okinawaensis]CAG9083643.1 unnamed protein product [Bursaphelenchus okinawaensis]